MLSYFLIHLMLKQICAELGSVKPQSKELLTTIRYRILNQHETALYKSLKHILLSLPPCLGETVS